MEHDTKSSLNQLWKAQVRQVAAHDPRLAQQLWQNRQVYYARFATYYLQLANLPRKYRRKFLRRLATTLAGAALLLALGQTLPAHAASITVDGVVCTLAEAIDSANNDNPGRTGCVSGSGADTLDLQTDVLLAAALPPITSEITLEGNGHVIDGNLSFQVLNVQATGNLNLNNSIITGGYGDYFDSTVGGGIFNLGILMVNNSSINGNHVYLRGGGIYNAGELTLNDSTLSGNFAEGYGSGIYNSGTLAINNSTLTGNGAGGYGAGTNEGGGIYNSELGIVTINDSTLSGNGATYSGGGISNAGALTLNNSILSGNGTSYGGGGIFNHGILELNNTTLNNNSGGSRWGGGIWNTGTAMVANSTLSGNSADYGGGIENWGALTVTNSTLSGNSAFYFYGGPGGGIDNFGTLSLSRTIISGNLADAGAEVFNSGNLSANDYNVFGYSGDAHSYGFTPGPTDIIPPGALDTVLDTTLANNGGSTLTHALVSGSVAIDAAPSDACLAPPINGIDQRGYARNVDGNGAPSPNECDSGAFEFVPVGNPTPTSTPPVTPRPTRPAHPTATATPHVSPTSTRTPRATSQPPYPLAPTSIPMLDTNQEIGPAASPQDQPPNLLVRFIAYTLEALGDFL